MGYDGTQYSSGALSSIATRLQAASDKVEEGPDVPPAPDAGEVTGDVLSVLSILSGGAAKVVEGLSEASIAVTHNCEVYRRNEQDQVAGINRLC